MPRRSGRHGSATDAFLRRQPECVRHAVRRARRGRGARAHRHGAAPPRRARRLDGARRSDRGRHAARRPQRLRARRARGRRARHASSSTTAPKRGSSSTHRAVRRLDRRVRHAARHARVRSRRRRGVRAARRFVEHGRVSSSSSSTSRNGTCRSAGASSANGKRRRTACGLSSTTRRACPSARVRELRPRLLAGAESRIVGAACRSPRSFTRTGRISRRASCRLAPRTSAREQSHHLDIGVRREVGDLTWSVTGFATRYHDFIYLAATGEVDCRRGLADLRLRGTTPRGSRASRPSCSRRSPT